MIFSPVERAITKESIRTTQIYPKLVKASQSSTWYNITQGAEGFIDTDGLLNPVALQATTQA
jgi:hypothetical protein